MKPSDNGFDAIIIGSGPGGATVAKDLSQNGKKVLVLERGGMDAVKGSFFQYVKNCFIPGKSLFVTSNLLSMVRGITVGGSSLHYCGTCFDPPVDMLKAYGVDISKETAEMKKEIPTAKLSDDLMSPAGELFLKSATDLGYDCKKLDKFIYQDKCMKNCDLCDYGCPFGAKWNARHFMDEAIENGSQLITNAKVGKVLIENNKAIGVEYKKDKKLHRAHADKIILAAGGIGSPVILRKTGLPGLGHDFFIYRCLFVLGKVPGLSEGRGIPMCAGIHLKEEGIMLTDFNMPRAFKTIFDLGATKINQLFSYKDILPIMIKVRDELGGRLTKNGWTIKSFSKDDKYKLKTGQEHATRILENLGATEIYKTLPIAGHPGGTVKLGEHVDQDLKTKFKNLYVCDSSVIPEKLGLPPTLTIISLARRLSNHLISKDKSQGMDDSIAAVSTHLKNSIKPDTAKAMAVNQSR